jgi:hypothetical protein
MQKKVRTRKNLGKVAMQTALFAALSCLVSVAYLSNVAQADEQGGKRQKWKDMTSEERAAAKEQAQQGAEAAAGEARSKVESATPEDKETAKAKARSKARERAGRRRQR